ncbi:AbrB/MazE/SpoVT family DNA-binding domain-containing protein [Roseomonas sp. BN140053]|uniref:AbrB/MazE/SpoVT family DNA-binding domain-containing protein n=1 Tax=Roseomonas sp. BN140053 TaxID=3391898 RepID=UPI0039EBA292
MFLSRRMLAKVTAKNQLTLPRAALEALGWPSHFRVDVSGGALVLRPAALVSEGEVAVALGLDAEALREVRRAMRRRNAAAPQPGPA